jgi:hypothetical protein
VFVCAACVCGASVTVLSMIFARPWVFALKVGFAALGINLIGLPFIGAAPAARPAPTI